MIYNTENTNPYCSLATTYPPFPVTPFVPNVATDAARMTMNMSINQNGLHPSPNEMDSPMNSKMIIINPFGLSFARIR